MRHLQHPSLSLKNGQLTEHVVREVPEHQPQIDQKSLTLVGTARHAIDRTGPDR